MIDLAGGTLRSALCNRHWSFAKRDGTVIAPRLRLQPDGGISGYRHRNEAAWRIAGDQLDFVDVDGRTTTRFTAVVHADQGLLGFDGAFLGEPAGPNHVLVACPDAIPATRRAASARRNLVVMRAGDSGLFGQWPASARRNWDIAISSYGDGELGWTPEYLVRQKGPKWQPIHAWLTGNPGLLDQYDYFWFPDDDIMTSWHNVDDIFDQCRNFDLALAQPALTANSYRFHQVTIENPDCLLRFTRFVEGMVPVFRADALRVCLPVLAEESRFGWGHDWVFPKLLGYPPTGIAILDACPVIHTRPAGLNTDLAIAERQKWEVVRKYGAEFMDHRVRGAVFRQPLPGHVER